MPTPSRESLVATQREIELTWQFCSPLGSQDWPLGEAPPAGYFDQPLSLDSTASGQPPGADAPLADKSADRYEGEKVGGGGVLPRSSPSKAYSKPHKPRRLEGLEEEAAFVHQFGTDAVDDLLGEGKDSTRDLLAKDELLILDVNEGNVDNETEDERENKDGPARKKVKTRRDVRESLVSVYLCCSIVCSHLGCPFGAVGCPRSGCQSRQA